LSLKISASRLNIKNLVDYFGAIYVGNMNANFQASISTGVGGGVDRWKDRCNAIFGGNLNEISKLPLCFALHLVQYRLIQF